MAEETSIIEAKAALADKVFNSGYMDWYEYTDRNDVGCFVCRFCGEAAWASDMVDHLDHCPKIAYDTLTNQAGGKEA